MGAISEIAPGYRLRTNNFKRSTVLAPIRPLIERQQPAHSYCYSYDQVDDEDISEMFPGFEVLDNNDFL